MYINRTPLGEGNLTFGSRKKKQTRWVYWRIILYLAVLAAALFVFQRSDVYGPRILAYIGPTPVPTPTAQDRADMAYQAYMDGDLEQAIAYYRDASALEPSNIDYLFELARLLILTGQTEEGLAISDQIILIAPESPDGYAIQAMALDWMGRPDEAVVTALRALEIDPYHALTHAYLAEAYIDLGRWTQAREEAELAVELDPFNVDVRRNYAYVLENTGYYQSAVQQYLQAIALQPNLLYLWYGLARNYRGAGLTDEAVRTYQEIIARTPDDPQPYTELGRTYFEMRDDAAAQDNLEQAVALVRAQNEAALEADPNADAAIYIPAWTRLGMVYFTRRNYEDAIAIFEETIAWCEAHNTTAPLEAYYVTGAAYFYLDECDRAVPLLFQALELNEEGPNDQGVTDNALRGLELCRNYAEHPMAFAWPEGYPVPDVSDLFLTRDGSTPAADETGSEGEQP